MTGLMRGVEIVASSWNDVSSEQAGAQPQRTQQLLQMLLLTTF
jgi:hypothetical protein